MRCTDSFENAPAQSAHIDEALRAAMLMAGVLRCYWLLPKVLDMKAETLEDMVKEERRLTMEAIETAAAKIAVSPDT